MTSHFRKAFYYQGKRLFSYPLDTEVDDMQIATIEGLAYQCGCAHEEIGVFLEECAPKQWDFSRDCVSEFLGERNGREQWRVMVVSNGKLHTHSGPLSSFIMQYEAGSLAG